MRTLLMLADAESWVQTALRRRITLHKLGAEAMQINAPSMRTRARMAMDPGRYRPMRVAEEPVATSSSVPVTARRRGL